MAGAYKRKSDRARGKAGKWSAWWIDERGKQRSRAAFTDKAATEALARKLELEAARVREGLVPAAELARRDASRLPIARHVADYEANLLARGGGASHAKAAASSLRRLLADAGVETLADLSGDRIQAALAKVRASRTPRTANYALGQARAFARWLVAAGRLQASPFGHLTPFSQAVGRKRVRRALAAEEATRLVAAAEAGPPVRSRVAVRAFAEVTGPERAMLYRIALGTGYRANEIRNLTPASFRLDASPPSVVLPAEATKDGKPAEQPIRRDLAGRLRAWFAARPPGAPVVPVPINAAKIVRHDLAAAGIPFETPDGCVDFHALRATYITLLIRAGVDIKTVQLLARHANPLMTLQMYCKSSEQDRTQAVEKLPAF